MRRTAITSGTIVLGAAFCVLFIAGGARFAIGLTLKHQLTPMTGGAPKAIPAGDMIMRDAKGVCCSIIYGQDNRSPITAEASHVLYVAYAPAGVPHDVVEAHLQLIEEHARLVSPSAVTEQRRLLVA